MSAADLASLITMVWTCLSFTFNDIGLNLPFESLEVAYLVSGIPHCAFSRVSGCITAMISLERCMSIVAPLKVIVKHIDSDNVVLFYSLFLHPHVNATAL